MLRRYKYFHGILYPTLTTVVKLTFQPSISFWVAKLFAKSHFNRRLKQPWIDYEAKSVFTWSASPTDHHHGGWLPVARTAIVDENSLLRRMYCQDRGMKLLHF